MEYPNVPISQETWNNMFKRSKNINPIQKYIDIQSTKAKKRRTKRKATPSTKRKAPKKSKKSSKKTSIKKSQGKDIKQKSRKKQMVYNAPVNFM